MSALLIVTYDATVWFLLFYQKDKKAR